MSRLRFLLALSAVSLLAIVPSDGQSQRPAVPDVRVPVFLWPEAAPQGDVLRRVPPGAKVFDPGTGKWRDPMPLPQGGIIRVPNPTLPPGTGEVIRFRGEDYWRWGNELRGPVRGGCLYLGIVRAAPLRSISRPQRRFRVTPPAPILLPRGDEKRE